MQDEVIAAAEAALRAAGIRKGQDVDRQRADAQPSEAEVEPFRGAGRGRPASFRPAGRSAGGQAAL